MNNMTKATDTDWNCKNCTHRKQEFRWDGKKITGCELWECNFEQKPRGYQLQKKQYRAESKLEKGSRSEEQR